VRRRNGGGKKECMAEVRRNGGGKKECMAEVRRNAANRIRSQFVGWGKLDTLVVSEKKQRIQKKRGHW
jgi:hypothetical protein